MDPNDLHEELDDAFWFSDGITALYQKGVKYPIYDILGALERDAKFSKRAERCVEQAIGTMIDNLNAEEKAEFKQRLADAIHGHIIIQIFTGDFVLMLGEPVVGSNSYYDYKFMCQETFANERDASEFLHKTFQKLNIDQTMEQCCDLVQRTVFEGIFDGGAIKRLKFKVKIVREHVFL